MTMDGHATDIVPKLRGHFPYGESWYNAAGDKLMFTTYERDAESGNDYAQARSYVNRLGRFSSLDPLPGDISDPQSLNRYSYVRNMPVMLADPSGACPSVAQNTPDGYIEGQGNFVIARFLSSDSDADPDPQILGGYAAGGCDNPGAGSGGGFFLDGGDNTNYSGYGGFVLGTSGAGIGELINFLTASASTDHREPGPCALEGSDRCLIGTSVTVTVTDFPNLGLLSFLGGQGGGGGVALTDVASLKATLLALFENIPACAALLGGNSAAQQLVNQANILNTETPIDLSQISSQISSQTGVPSNVAQAAVEQTFQDAASGQSNASIVFGSQFPGGGPWNGGPFTVFLGPTFQSLSPSQRLTNTIHELEHPAYSGTEDYPGAIDSQRGFDMISSQCKTAPVPSGHLN